MNGFSITIFAALVTLALGQGLLTVVFLRKLAGFRREPTPDGDCPKAAVVLCLRGCDPFLERCMERLLDQDYPDYRLHVVVDHRDDPAWAVAQSMADRHGADRVHIEALDDRRETCSLKLSSVTQAVERLDDSVGFVALVDADTMPHRTWLRELAAPLADPRAGAATGNRWYMPSGGSWGAMVRYLWNAAAIVQMYWYKVPWGGTLAVSRKVIDEAGLLDRWRHAFCEDTMLYHQLGQRGLNVEFVPSLMMVNREDVGLRSCTSWISRQLLTMRLYHPLWPLVLLHGAGTTLLLGVTMVAMVVAAIKGDWTAAAWLGGGLLAYEAIMVCLLWPMEWLVRRIVRSHGGATGWLSWKTLLRIIPAIVLTQIAYTIALIGAQFARTVTWRGVHYRIHAPWHIERLDDPRYHDDEQPTADGHSL